MQHPCQCPYETASLQVAEGEMRGYLACAVCGGPKHRLLPDALMQIPEAARLLGIGADNLRTLIVSGSIKPTVRGVRRLLVSPAHILAQLSQKGLKR